MDPKVLVGLPTTGDMIHAEFAKSLLQLRQPPGTELFWCGHTITSAARNICAARALADDCSHLLFLDVDQTFHPETIYRLLSHGVPVVSGLYRPRRGNGQYFAFNFDESGMPHQVYDIDMAEGPELLKVDGVPTGCLMIEVDVFRQLTAAMVDAGQPRLSPWFKYEDALPVNRWLQAEAAREGRAATSVDVDHVMAKVGYGKGEDLYFCDLCKQAGIPVYIDTRLTCGHLTTREIGSARLLV